MPAVEMCFSHKYYVRWWCSSLKKLPE